MCEIMVGVLSEIMDLLMKYQPLLYIIFLLYKYLPTSNRVSCLFLLESMYTYVQTFLPLVPLNTFITKCYATVLFFLIKMMSAREEVVIVFILLDEMF